MSGADAVENMLRMHQVTLAMGGAILDLMGTLATPEAIWEAHRRGVCVWLWTLNEREHIQMAIDADVDGITSNHPDRLNEMR